MPAQCAFPPIEDLLPHRGSMLLLQRITDSDGSGIVAEAVVPSEAWYLDDSGAMPTWVGIEMMAQAAAAQVGLSARLNGSTAKPGVLLGTRDFRANFPDAASGTVLRVAARMTLLDDGGFAVFECAVSDGRKRICSATLSVYQPDDFAEFLSRTMA